MDGIKRTSRTEPQKKPSAAKRDQGVGKKLSVAKRKGVDKKRHLLQMEIRESTKNGICFKGGSGGGQKTPSAAKGDQGGSRGSTKNAI